MRREPAVPYLVLAMLVVANLIQAVVVKRRDAEIRELRARVVEMEHIQPTPALVLTDAEVAALCVAFEASKSGAK